jgi:hypothetical protein
MKQDLDNPARGGGIALPQPGLQIVIVLRDTGMIERTVGPPLIEHDHLDQTELEPPRR